MFAVLSTIGMIAVDADDGFSNFWDLCGSASKRKIAPKIQKKKKIHDTAISMICNNNP